MEIKSILHSLMYIENEAKKLKMYDLQFDILRALSDASKKYGIDIAQERQ